MWYSATNKSIAGEPFYGLSLAPISIESDAPTLMLVDRLHARNESLFPYYVFTTLE